MAVVGQLSNNMVMTVTRLVRLESLMQSATTYAGLSHVPVSSYHVTGEDTECDPLLESLHSLLQSSLSHSPFFELGPNDVTPHFDSASLHEVGTVDKHPFNGYLHQWNQGSVTHKQHNSGVYCVLK